MDRFWRTFGKVLGEQSWQTGEEPVEGLEQLEQLELLELLEQLELLELLEQLEQLEESWETVVDCEDLSLVLESLDRDLVFGDLRFGETTYLIGRWNLENLEKLWQTLKLWLDREF